MKKVIFSLLILSVLSSCSSGQINNSKDLVNPQINDISSKEIKFSFKVKDAQSLSRVKSVDAYLVNNLTSPLVSTSNVYPNGFKVQTNVVNGVINITFNNYPVGGPYYLAMQSFDDVISSSARNNITEINNSVTQGDKKVSLSNNSVSYINGALVYSDSSNSLNISINLIPFNEPPVNINPENGKDSPTNTISVG